MCEYFGFGFSKPAVQQIKNPVNNAAFKLIHFRLKLYTFVAFSLIRHINKIFEQLRLN